VNCDSPRFEIKCGYTVTYVRPCTLASAESSGSSSCLIEFSPVLSPYVLVGNLRGEAAGLPYQNGSCCLCFDDALR
jgi:hypothetical protein